MCEVVDSMGKVGGPACSLVGRIVLSTLELLGCIHSSWQLRFWDGGGGQGRRASPQGRSECRSYQTLGLTHGQHQRPQGLELPTSLVQTEWQPVFQI